MSHKNGGCIHDLDLLLKKAGEEVYPAHVKFIGDAMHIDCPYESFLRVHALFLTCTGVIKLLFEQLEEDDVKRFLDGVDGYIESVHWKAFRDKLLQQRKDVN